ncbi:histidine kinase dimerization/phosphoacceptor domain -containing protein [Marispirochaeta sp.]|uniref:histidine kinase dimerization/phosphoacceptor domain -containing protein n=1 Tax=Marispirochaeta sp. TaxID=2038653 RepID=UPI0029C65121|nr:histidine kinase dimerization/phosphoacceptor domain -containing protein [Marispirochaeta sp.]
MFKIIEIIDRHKIRISISLVVLYLLSSAAIVRTPEVDVQHIIFIAAPTVLFSLVHYYAGIAVGLVSVLIVLITHFEQQHVILTLNTYVLYGVGIIINTGMSYLVGALKDAYLQNKKAFQEVEKSKEKYQKVVDNIKEGMVIVDTNGTVIFMNRSASAMLNLSVNNLGFIFLDIFKTSIPYGEGCGVDENGLGLVTEYLLEYDHPEHGIRQIAVAETPYLNREGNLSGSLKFLQDITDTKKKEITIELLKKRNEYLFAELHDRINNNLTTIHSFINLYLRNGEISKSEGLDKVDDFIHTMAFLNCEFFKNFRQQTVNLETCMSKITHDLSEKYYYSSILMHLNLVRKDVHVDIAVPFSMLFTLIMATIFLIHRDEVIKPAISIDMSIADGKSEILIAVEKSGFFAKLKNSETRKTEKEVLAALLKQLHGNISIVDEAENIIKLVF